MFGFARYRYWGRRATVQGALALVGTLAAAQTPAPADPLSVCVRNAGEVPYFFAAEATGIARETGWLKPG